MSYSAATDWASDLEQALASKDSEAMGAILDKVPEELRLRAAPYAEAIAAKLDQDGKYAEALSVYQSALRLKPDQASIKENIDRLNAHIRHQALLSRALEADSEGVQIQIEPSPRPKIKFDPALLSDPAIPDDCNGPMLEGLKQHLLRYSAHQSSRNILSRLEDTLWLAAWDLALSSTNGANVLLCGSELGTFALRAIRHGATRARAVETFALDGRVSAGIVQKHQLKAWQNDFQELIASWSEEERCSSFTEFSKDIDVVTPESLADDTEPSDCFIFPNIDHTLLGTGIVKALKQYLAHLKKDARVLPAKARIHAMAIEWTYDASGFLLQPMNRFRWSAYPKALDLPDECWRPLSHAVCVGSIDFANFTPAVWNAELPILTDGSVDAIVFWFDLDLGASSLSNAPHSALECIRPAVQYTDPVSVSAGATLPIEARVHETRIEWRLQSTTKQLRDLSLPSWYIPMLLDRQRNEAYRGALKRTLAAEPANLTLDVGAGCGLLSMMAATAGAREVIGCEVEEGLCRSGDEVIALNRLESQITLINKDCRRLTVPGDLGQRADLAIFELFDCSLIGEGVLHYLAYAREHLLAKHARYLPLAGRIRAMVVEYRLEKIWDIDVNLLNPYRYSSSFINVDARKLNYRALSEPFDLFSFEFDKATPAPDEKTLALSAIADGIAGAVLFWFDLQLDRETWISNEPGGAQQLHWNQGLQFLPEVRVSSGKELPLAAKHDGSSLAIRWRREALNKDMLSSLPRFDPRWWQQVNELQQQTQGLLEHCHRNPDQYRKVADLAQRIAVDPAQHGIDPIVAQRFARVIGSG